MLKLKAFADDKLNVAQKLKFALGRVENMMGKGENAGYQHFLRFRQCFQKAFFSGVSKVSLCGKGLTHSHTMTLLTTLGKKPFENTVGKGEIARNEQFLLFPQCFLPV